MGWAKEDSRQKELIHMEPLRIDFTLVTPMRIPEHPIHFDGVLAWAAVQDGMDRGIPMEEAQENIPLGRQGERDEAVWMASWINFAPGPRSIYPITRPFRLTDLVMDMGRSFKQLRRAEWKSEMSSSVNKAYLLQHPVRHVTEAHAWCMGNRAEIERLLSTWVTHLGKLSRLDMGRINTATVTSDPAASEKWRLRSLPWQEDGYVRAYETVKPPYWKRENRREAWVPLV
jgi:CRISPR type IV-associated protein Csf3